MHPQLSPVMVWGATREMRPAGRQRWWTWSSARVGDSQGQGGPRAREPSLWAGRAFLGISGRGQPPGPCRLSPLRPPSSLQGWVFNVVPWLVAIPASLFSGFLSDHLINQGEPWGRGRWEPARLCHTWGVGSTPPGGFYRDVGPCPPRTSRQCGTPSLQSWPPPASVSLRGLGCRERV